MEFRVPGFSVGMQHNQVYPTPSASVSFNYTNFSDQTSEGGPARMREAIQRELEKEMIREKIIAEEVERFHVLEAEVRRELMIGREMMAMKNGMGFPSSFMLGPQPGEIRQHSTLPLKVGTGNLNCPTLPEATLKPPPPPPPPPSLPATGGSTEHNPCIPKKKMEWRCSICKISTTCERGLLEHLAGKCHHVKAASIVMNNSPKCSPSSNQKMEWRCSICEVSAPCEQGLQDHLAGKKHESKVAALKADNTETELLEKKMEWTWMCPICKIEMKSEINFQSHLAGKKHKAKVAIRKGKII